MVQEDKYVTNELKNDTFGEQLSLFENQISGGEHLLKPKEVATLLGISRNTVYNWNYLGKLKPIIFSKRMVRYKYSDIIKLIETRETTQEVIS